MMMKIIRILTTQRKRRKQTRAARKDSDNDVDDNGNGFHVDPSVYRVLNIVARNPARNSVLGAVSQPVSRLVVINWWGRNTFNQWKTF